MFLREIVCIFHDEYHPFCIRVGAKDYTYVCVRVFMRALFLRVYILYTNMFVCTLLLCAGERLTDTEGLRHSQGVTKQVSLPGRA